MTKPVEKTIFMPKKAFNKWVKELVSGKHKQGNGYLCNKDGSMCCLGVLEYALEGKVERGVFPSSKFLKRNNINFKNSSLLTKDNAVDPTLTGGTASMLNDIEKLTFKQIAQRLKSRVQFVPEKKK